jgi:hypothetical protein
MNALVLGFMREMLGRWGLLILFAGIYSAAQLSFNDTLGDATIGTYLAYASLWPIGLLFRCGWLMQKRRAEGWPLEELLRDPKGHRAPLAEFSACGLLTALGLLAAMLPIAVLDLNVPEDSVALHPVRMESNEAGQWLLNLGGRTAENSTLLLTLDWSDVQGDSLEAVVQNPVGETQNAIAGEILRWPLSAAEAHAGKLVLFPPADLPLRVFQPLLRLEIPRPGPSQLGSLLAGQLLFFLPLFAMLLALARFGRSNAKLAAWAVFFIGSLIAFHPPLFLAPAGIHPLALIFLTIKSALPAVDGLLASGHRFERLAGTTSSAASMAWLMLGGLCLLLACKRRKER